MYYFSSSYTVYYPFERLFIGILNPYYNIYYTFNVLSPISHSFAPLSPRAFRTLKTTPFARSAHTHQALKSNPKESPLDALVVILLGLIPVFYLFTYLFTYFYSRVVSLQDYSHAHPTSIMNSIPTITIY